MRVFELVLLVWFGGITEVLRCLCSSDAPPVKKEATEYFTPGSLPILQHFIKGGAHTARQTVFESGATISADKIYSPIPQLLGSIIKKPFTFLSDTFFHRKQNSYASETWKHLWPYILGSKKNGKAVENAFYQPFKHLVLEYWPTGTKGALASREVEEKFFAGILAKYKDVVIEMNKTISTHAWMHSRLRELTLTPHVWKNWLLTEDTPPEISMDDNVEVLSHSGDLHITDDNSDHVSEE